MTTCRIEATRGHEQFHVRGDSATCGPYVRALSAAGWTVTTIPTPAPAEAAGAPWVRQRADDAEDGW